MCTTDPSQCMLGAQGRQHMDSLTARRGSPDGIAPSLRSDSGLGARAKSVPRAAPACGSLAAWAIAVVAVIRATTAPRRRLGDAHGDQDEQHRGAALPDHRDHARSGWCDGICTKSYMLHTCAIHLLPVGRPKKSLSARRSDEGRSMIVRSMADAVRFRKRAALSRASRPSTTVEA